MRKLNQEKPIIKDGKKINTASGEKPVKKSAGKKGQGIKKPGTAASVKSVKK